jgi:hypothetical protein
MTTQEKIQKVAQQIISNKEMLADMRQHIHGGFAHWNVADHFQGETNTRPFEGLNDHEYGLAWIEVRNLVHPHVKEPFDKYGEFRKVP